METRIIEIRDEGTHIPALAIRMQRTDPLGAYYVHLRCGYPPDGSGIVLMEMDHQRATVDPYEWSGSRTMQVAHDHIYNNFDKLKDGDVVDVQFLLGETTEPKKSERLK